MGKKRIVTGSAEAKETSAKTGDASGAIKKRVDSGILCIQSTYNNTQVSFTDKNGNLLCASSSGALGFKGAKKGTPFAAAKVGELIGEKAKLMGVKTADAVIKGVGAGRESSLRAFASKGIGLNSIKDATPVPHNGPRPPKPRRV